MGYLYAIAGDLRAHKSDDFSIAGAGYVLPDGSIGTTAGHKGYKLNATTGAVVASVTLADEDNFEDIDKT